MSSSLHSPGNIIHYHMTGWGITLRENFQLKGGQN